MKGNKAPLWDSIDAVQHHMVFVQAGQLYPNGLIVTPATQGSPTNARVGQRRSLGVWELASVELACGQRRYYPVLRGTFTNGAAERSRKNNPLRDKTGKIDRTRLMQKFGEGVQS